MRNRKREAGNQTVEFTLIGIPLTFLLFSIANMCFSMLTLHTLQEAVEQGGRYVVTRGSTCSSGSNTCTATVSQIVAAVANSAPGVSRSKLNVQLKSANGTTTCNPVTTCLGGTCSCTGSACPASCSSVWPPTGDNAPGADITITADCAVSAPMYMFWPGSGSASKGQNNHFYAQSQQRLMF